MSKSEFRTKIRSYLTDVICKQTYDIPFITSDGMEFRITDAFICPLCMNIINVEDKGRITLEDVPPESVGGHPVLVTCSKCNNSLGGRIDNYLYNELLIVYLLSHPENHSFKTVFNVNGKKIKGRLRIETKEGYRFLHCTIDGNDRGNYPSFTSEIENHWDGCQIEMTSLITDVKRNDEFSNAAKLKSAYLLAFSKLGYMYILSDNLDLVRQQIQNPDDDILCNSYIIGSCFDILSELKDGVYYAKVNEIDCIVVLLSFHLNSVDTANHRVVIALPHPEDKECKLYSMLSKMGDSKKMQLLEVTKPLPIRKIRIKETVSEIINE